MAGIEIQTGELMAGALVENKFIVLHTKVLAKLGATRQAVDIYAVETFRSALNNLVARYNDRFSPVVPLERKQYYVCNRDEPYAAKVLAVILEGEKEKLKCQQSR